MTITVEPSKFPPTYIDRLEALLQRARDGQAAYLKSRALIYASQAYSAMEIERCLTRDGHAAELQIARLEEFIAMEKTHGGA